MDKCFKNLIFDIDGTIWNTTDVVAGAWNQAIKESNIPELSNLNVTGERLKQEFGKPMDVIADNLFGPIDPLLKSNLLKRCCILEHEAIACNNDDLSYENIRSVIRELAENHNIFIVSNCQDGYIELVMEKNGIEDIVKDIECFGHTGLQKDENITLLLNRNGIDLEEAVYIGDTMGDYIATKKAGLRFVHAGYGFGEVTKPDYVVHSPIELIEIMK